MENNLESQAFIARMIQWGKEQPLVRAMILTSTRAIPNAGSDILSDYDIILALEDIHPFHKQHTWLDAFGTLLALYRDPIEYDYGYAKSGYVIQFENSLKIDFSLWEVGYLRKIATDPQLPAEFDAGYQVLLDKDALTQGLKPPTYQAYIPKPPSEADYLETIEVFFVDAAYVAKFIWRDEMTAAKTVLDYFLKQEHLLPMLVWRTEIDHQWSLKPGLYGRGLKKRLRPDLWTDLENTYCGLEPGANWTALFNSINLMRKAAIEVGDKLGYAYPHDLHRRALAYLYKVKNLDHTANSFNT